MTEKQYTKYERISFLKKIYGGATKPMIAVFIGDAKLSKNDIAVLASFFSLFFLGFRGQK